MLSLARCTLCPSLLSHLMYHIEAISVGLESFINKVDSVITGITAYRCHPFAVLRGGTYFLVSSTAIKPSPTLTRVYITQCQPDTTSNTTHYPLPANLNAWTTGCQCVGKKLGGCDDVDVQCERCESNRIECRPGYSIPPSFLVFTSSVDDCDNNENDDLLGCCKG
ncbi:hypothetical protein F5888DRAFT_1630781 [Russula emetica]|nr:hypothetical protein F5888DRAFT_1630781 [Russula emetica]